MTKRVLLAALAWCCLTAEAFAQAKEAEAAKGGIGAMILGLLCLAFGLAVLGGGVFGLVWLIRRKSAQARGGFEGGVSGAAASGIDDAFERHRRAKKAKDEQNPEQPS